MGVWHVFVGSSFGLQDGFVFQYLCACQCTFSMVMWHFPAPTRYIRCIQYDCQRGRESCSALTSLLCLQNVRTQAFVDFGRCKRGVLMCTDVAARGLDFPAVTHIVQLDPPGEAAE